MHKFYILKLLIVLVFIIQKTNAQKYTQKSALRKANKAWRTKVPNILQQIVPTTFSAVEVKVQVGADFTINIQRSIDELHKAGGGTVIIPEGNHTCQGPIVLKSNINLRLSEGANIIFSENPFHYLPVVKVRWEGTVCFNYSPFVYAYQQKNIAITGNGTLNGQADKFWHQWKKQPNGDDQEKDKKRLRDMGRDSVPEAQRVFGEGHKLRPSLIEFFECENILLEGITVKQSPFWTIHPVFCRNVTIRNMNILGGTTNDDGIDPDGCKNVLIENCIIDTDDDPIAIKAGRDNDAWKRPNAENIVIRNIKARSRVGNGFCIGSEMSSGVSNIFVENYTITRADNGINIKSNLDRGGFVKNIYLRNVQVDSCTRNGIMMQKDYHSYRGGNYPPLYANIVMQNVNINYVQKIGISITGVPTQSITNTVLKKVFIKKQGNANNIRHVQNLYISNSTY